MDVSNKWMDVDGINWMDIWNKWMDVDGISWMDVDGINQLNGCIK